MPVITLPSSINLICLHMYMYNIMCYGNTNIYSNLAKANSFNNYFYYIFTKFSPTTLNNESIQLSKNSLNNIHVTYTYLSVLDTLSTLKSTKVMGADEGPLITMPHHSLYLYSSLILFKFVKA